MVKSASKCLAQRRPPLRRVSHAASRVIRQYRSRRFHGGLDCGDWPNYQYAYSCRCLPAGYRRAPLRPFGVQLPQPHIRAVAPAYNRRAPLRQYLQLARGGGDLVCSRRSRAGSIAARSWPRWRCPWARAPLRRRPQLRLLGPPLECVHVRWCSAGRRRAPLRPQHGPRVLLRPAGAPAVQRRAPLRREHTFAIDARVR